MTRLPVVFAKEFRELITNRTTVLTGIAFVVLFGGMYAARIVTQSAIPMERSLSSILFFLPTILGVFLGYTATGHVFLREKTDGVIETLLSSPANAGEIWLGKTLAVTAFADVMSLGAGIIMSVVVSARSGGLMAVSPAVVFHLLVGVPLIVACLVGVLGFAQLVLGMRENRILSLALFVPVFGALYGLGYTATGAFVASWMQVLILAGGMAIVLAALLRVAGRISKERIVTSLP